MTLGFVSSSLRPGHPDFLDLPWHEPLDRWQEHCGRLEELPRGESRHSVVFVNYDGLIYALKEVPPGMAAKEYDLLRQMADLRLPVVTPAGHVTVRSHEGEASVLVTRYLDASLPYHALFLQGRLLRYREHLLDAMAILLVQMHLSGVFWGDCSLNNTLFRRDAGTLEAYVVDTETSEVQPSISDGLRLHDLEIMEENVAGGLLDLVAMGALEEGYPAQETARTVRQRYDALWEEITRDEVIRPHERYRIQERIRALNALGFSVGEVELQAAEGGETLRLRAMVTDQRFHRDLLHSLTGLEVERMQARQLVNEIRHVKARMSEQTGRSIPLSVAAHSWLTTLYRPITERLSTVPERDVDLAERYCQLLEHKWYLSEREQRDVGHERAADDYLANIAACQSDPNPAG